MIDSPLKTESFLKYAWELGCHINLDNEAEIDIMVGFGEVSRFTLCLKYEDLSFIVKMRILQDTS